VLDLRDDTLDLAREPVPVWLARRRSMACAFSCSVRKRAEGMSLSSFQ